MRRYSWVLIGVLWLISSAWAGSKFKDLVVRQHTTSEALGSKVHEETVYFSGSKSVSDTTDFRTIIDLDAKTLTTVDKRRKTYSVVSFDDLRGKVEAVRKDADEPQIKLKPTDKTEKIAGYEAKEYAIQGPQMNGSVWMAEALDPGAELPDWQAGNPLARAIAKLKGLPLRKTITASGEASSSTVTIEVVEVSKKAPPSNVLTVPDGFQKIASQP